VKAPAIVLKAPPVTCAVPKKADFSHFRFSFHPLCDHKPCDHGDKPCGHGTHGKFSNLTFLTLQRGCGVHSPRAKNVPDNSNQNPKSKTPNALTPNPAGNGRIIPFSPPAFFKGFQSISKDFKGFQTKFAYHRKSKIVRKCPIQDGLLVTESNLW
jgi:hypothetical protein